MRCFGRSREDDVSFNFSRLTETDELSAAAHLGDLNTLALHFGRSLLRVSPRDIPRLSAAVENDNSEEILELIRSSNTNSNATTDGSELRSIDVFRESFFTMAVEDCKTEWVEFFLDKIADKSILFDVGASMMKENFNNLWQDYRIHVEDMIKKDVFGWDICTLEVPLETFTVEANMSSRVGTCNTRLEWIHSSRQGTAFDHWKSLNTKGVDKILKKSRGRKINVIVRIFCFEDACQVGFDGIVRSLLLHKTSPSLFKTPLMKWIILFKWERVWRGRALKNLAFYLVFFLVFNVFLLLVSLELFGQDSIIQKPVVTIVITILLQLFALMLLRREYLQLRRYICDGKRIFPSRRFHGIRHYLGSRQNQIDLLLCCTLLAFVPAFFFGRTYAKLMSNLSGYYAVFAGAMLLMWAKALFLMQTFKKTGVFILMLGRVIQECLPYFFILIGIMVGFGLAMPVALMMGNPCTSGPPKAEDMQCRWRSDPGYGTSWYFYRFSGYHYYHRSRWYSHHYHPSYPGYYGSYYHPSYAGYYGSYYHPSYPGYSRSYYDYHSHPFSRYYHHYYRYPTDVSFLFCFVHSDEIKEKVNASFGTPYQAIISMAYATVGMFESEVFFHCGQLSWFVVALFVLYLVIQMIVMFNMLIAAMGDAFDGVRADEEESFLMARASFIDQNEASLTEKEVQALKSKIGKYLYVLIPEDKQLENNVPFWKGRIPTIKEDVKTIVEDSQERTIQNIHEVINGLKDELKNEIKNDMKSIEERLVESLEEKITKNLEERFVRLEQGIVNQLSAIKSHADN